MPFLVAPLADLGGLVAVGRADVEMQPELGGLGTGTGLEDDRGLRSAEPGSRRPDLDAARHAVQLDEPEHLAPEGGQVAAGTFWPVRPGPVSRRVMNWRVSGRR